MFDRDTVVQNVRRLAEAAKILMLPVVVTVQNAEKMGGTVSEVHGLLHEVEGSSKMSFSCCGSEEFNQTLAGLGRRTVIICGVETHICVSQTAHDLVSDGYKVHVPEDAVCSRTERNWRTGLEKMRQSGIIVTSVIGSDLRNARLRRHR